MYWLIECANELFYIYNVLCLFLLIDLAISDRWVLKSAHIILDLSYKIHQCWWHSLVWCMQLWVCYIILKTELFIVICALLFLWKCSLFWSLLYLILMYPPSSLLIIFDIVYIFSYYFSFNQSSSLDRKIIFLWTSYCWVI